MTAPDDKNLTDDDYLDADFESDLPDLNDDLEQDTDDFDDAEELFPSPQKKRSKKLLGGLIVATALAAGAGFYLINTSQPSPPLPVSSPPVDLTQTAAPAPEAPSDIPVIPTPASDFETPENTEANLPPVVESSEIPQPVTESEALPAVPANIGQDPSQTQQSASPVIAEAPPEIPTAAQIENIDDTQISPPADALPEVPQAPLAENAPPVIAEAPIANDAINLDTTGESSAAGMKQPENAENPAVEKTEQEEFQAIVSRAETVKPQPQENKAQTEYFDSPKGEFVRDLPPPTINPFTQPGQNLIIVNRNPTAGAVLEKGDNSALVESRLVSARRASALGKNEAALDFYNEIYRQNPRDPRILMGRAVTYQKLGETQRAIDAYNEVLEVQPENPEALTNLMGLVVKTSPAVALENLLNLREKFPRNPAIAAQLGVAYTQSGNPQDGLRYLKLASDLEPKNALHYFNMAVISEHLGDTAGAIVNYEKTLDTSAVHGLGKDASFSREQVYDRLSRLRGS